MGNYNRISLIGTHGAGKGFILENGPLFGCFDISKNPVVRSSVSAFWEAINEPVLRDIHIVDRFKYQFSLIGVGVNQYLENKNGVFERSPLDIVAYCELLVEDAQKEFEIGGISRTDFDYTKQTNLIELSKQALFPFTEKEIDILVYVPYDARIAEIRQEVTDYKELKNNSQHTDELIIMILREYFEYNSSNNTSKRKTKFIHLNCQPEERLKVLKNSLEKLDDNCNQFVFNGLNLLI
ncbi:hypothetical protein HC864_02365 [Candidatus Gracilibacteria bacterium]|nr:hypothetical protein [Candidatus Gracilibacteria bacterium]